MSTTTRASPNAAERVTNNNLMSDVTANASEIYDELEESAIVPTYSCDEVDYGDNPWSRPTSSKGDSHGVVDGAVALSHAGTSKSNEESQLGEEFNRESAYVLQEPHSVPEKK